MSPARLLWLLPLAKQGKLHVGTTHLKRPVCEILGRCASVSMDRAGSTLRERYLQFPLPGPSDQPHLITAILCRVIRPRSKIVTFGCGGAQFATLQFSLLECPFSHSGMSVPPDTVASCVRRWPFPGQRLFSCQLSWGSRSSRSLDYPRSDPNSATATLPLHVAEESPVPRGAWWHVWGTGLLASGPVPFLPSLLFTNSAFCEAPSPSP